MNNDTQPQPTTPPPTPTFPDPTPAPGSLPSVLQTRHPDTTPPAPTNPPMPSGSFGPNVAAMAAETVDIPSSTPPVQSSGAEPAPWSPYAQPQNATPPPPAYSQYDPYQSYPPQNTDYNHQNQSYYPPINQPPTPPRQHHIPQMTPPSRPKRYDKLPLPIRIVDWLKGNWWAPVLVVSLLLVVFNIMYQVFLPYNTVPQGVVVDGVALGGLEQEAAAKKLDDAYGQAKAKIYFGSASVPYKTPTGRELGISTNSQERLKHATYPVLWRLVPTSSFWIGKTIKVPPAIYSYDTATLDTYTLKNLGNNCKINPKDATLKLDDNRFSVVPAVAGGTCNLSEFKSAVQKATIQNNGYTIRTGMKETPAAVSDATAKRLADKLNKTLAQDIPITANDKQDTVPARTAKTWLSFRTITPDANAQDKSQSEPTIGFKIEHDRLKRYIQSSRLTGAEQKPGITTISTKDFTETSRQDGASGVAINIEKTAQSATDVADGKTRNIVATVEAVGPTIKYQRSYTPTEEGFRALVEQFASDNKGDITLAVNEVSGRKPLVAARAKGDQAMPMGGMEGALVAYAAQVGIENGSIQPTNKIAGEQTYTQCITSAIAEQDKTCTEALLSGVGNATVTQYLRDLGLANTSFGEQPTTTANDIQTFMIKLTKDRGQLPIKRPDALLKPMRSNKVRDGIASVQPNSDVIAGVEGAYNQAALVGGQSGYVLTFLSKESNAQAISKFMNDFQKLRDQKPRQ